MLDDADFLQQTMENNALLEDNGIETLYEVVKRGDEYKVRGPDTDCWEAVDLERFHSAVLEVKSGRVEESKVPDKETERLQAVAGMGRLVLQFRRRVEKWLDERQGKEIPSSVFVEGFCCIQDICLERVG
jgi:hypothetical protein